MPITDKLVEHIHKRDFWVDNVENIVYSKVDMVLNSYTLEEVESCLEKVYIDIHKAGFVELLIHEQYFYSDYIDYIPEYEDIVLTAAKWLSEHGYQGALMSEVMFEKFRSSDLPVEDYGIF